VNKHQLTLTQAIAGYILAFQARKLSPNTLREYQRTFRKFLNHLQGDPPIGQITADQVKEFLAAQTTVSNKTVLNYHIGLSSLWAWALSEHLVTENLLHHIRRPRPEKRAIVPFSEADLRALTGAIDTSRPYTRPGKRECTHTVPNAERNRAIILLLLDTGLRATELCTIHLHDLDLKNRRVKLFGKGSKERSVPFSARTGQAIWRYLATRPDAHTGEPLFTTLNHTPFNADRLENLLANLGERAGVAGVHPHRFRHTFAISYLRNGGDPWSLQDMLGHATMEMVKRYLKLAQVDLDDAHRRASPVENWHL